MPCHPTACKSSQLHGILSPCNDVDTTFLGPDLIEDHDP
jgi:hypothetical protein